MKSTCLSSKKRRKEYIIPTAYGVTIGTNRKREQSAREEFLPAPENRLHT
jgi:hypothetical protein